MIDFLNGKSIVIPEGEVSVIARGTEILWRKQKYKRELPYLEGTGEQWLDTGIDNFADFEIGVKLRESVANKALGISNTCCVDRISAADPYWRFLGGTATFASKIQITEYHEIGWKHNKIFCDDEHIADCVKNTSTVGNFCLFTVYGSRAYPNLIYYVKMWDINDNLIRNFIPVLDWNDCPCMYDKVTDELFYNQGTGEFLYG